MHCVVYFQLSNSSSSIRRWRTILKPEVVSLWTCDRMFAHRSFPGGSAIRSLDEVEPGWFFVVFLKSINFLNVLSFTTKIYEFYSRT